MINDLFPECCQRCFKDANCLIMSMFNTDMICIKCSEKEKGHPNYDKAVQEDIEQIKKGNYNYKGIDKPTNL